LLTAGQEVKIEERPFVAKDAPLDGGQGRLGVVGQEGQEKEDRLNGHPLLGKAKQGDGNGLN
jgi:hypothetical protein